MKLWSVLLLALLVGCKSNSIRHGVVTEMWIEDSYVTLRELGRSNQFVECQVPQRYYITYRQGSAIRTIEILWLPYWNNVQVGDEFTLDPKPEKYFKPPPVVL